MTLREMISNGEEALRNAGIDEALNDAKLLAMHAGGFDRNHILLNAESEVTEDLSLQFNELIKRRASREPLQYITGVTNFMGLDFFVAPGVLIPRFDTEILAEEAFKAYEKISAAKGEKSLKVLDMCTGSGCLGITIKHRFKDAIVTCADICQTSLEISSKNAQKMGLDVEIIDTDLFSNITSSYDMIISNPPYIKTADLKTLMPEVIDHEPTLALDGGDDGLIFYEKISKAASDKYLNPGGMLLFEIGFDEAEDVENIMKGMGFAGVKTVKDLAGLDRVIIGDKNVR
ncbi:MAG: peptide chain release factor N(5)-glutamine methyltransferase [Lachnospiraceae bacterium]|nr:peptide chain release factor N(5)-glutamine methyltransferase [Lachnospiraceae bacterium]